MLQNNAQRAATPSDLQINVDPRFTDRKSLPNRRRKIAEPRYSSISAKKSKPNCKRESTEPRFSPFSSRRSMPNRRSRRTRDYEPITNCYLVKATLTIPHRIKAEFIVEKIHSEKSEPVWLKRLQASYRSNSDMLSPFSLSGMKFLFRIRPHSWRKDRFFGDFIGKAQSTAWSAR